MKIFNTCVFATTIVLLSSCTRLFLGSAELGSKTEPVRFVLEKSSLSKNVASTKDLQPWEECLEKQSGYRVRFAFSLNQASIFFDLEQGEAHMALVGVNANKNTKNTPEKINDTLPPGVRFLLGIRPKKETATDGSAALLPNPSGPAKSSEQGRALVASPFLAAKIATTVASHFVTCDAVGSWL